MKKRFVSRWSRDTNILARVVTGVLPTPEGLLERQRMIELQAIEAFAKGYATPDDFRVMCDVLNVAETMANEGIGRDEVSPWCTAMEIAMLDLKNRFDETGTMQADEMEVGAMREVYEYHDLQRTSVDWSTYERMIVKTANNILSQHPSVKVLV